MPWRESSPMTERLAFIQACVDRTENIVDICDRFGISKKTGHKWLARFRAQGLDGLAERSHAPKGPAHRVAPELEERIVALRKQHPKYGAALLRDWLVQHEPTTPWPAASTIGALLTRRGLIPPRRRRQPDTHAALGQGRTAATAPNVVWTADFKGESRLTSGAWCYPLTVLDLHSHYLLRCTGLARTNVALSRTVFEQLFREYGLPQVLRTDNGVPFAQPNSIGRLGALGFWWVRLGIRPEHIRPAQPAENGAHERFHKTLKAATVPPSQPRAPSFGVQQRRFDAFQHEYNVERPHTSLPGHRPPASVYTPSLRPYPRRLPPVLYPPGSQVRLVTSQGSIHWRNQWIFLSSNLLGEYVRLTQTTTELVTIQYAQLALGEWDPHTEQFTARVRWAG